MNFSCCGIVCFIFAILASSIGANPSMFELDANANLTDNRSVHSEHDVFEHYPKTQLAEDLECGIWLAPSTIPGAGLGMFAGRDFEVDEPFLSTGDLVIPVIDMYHHNEEKSKFLWDEYTWEGTGMLMDGEALGVQGASPGFGAVPNCFPDLVNANELTPGGFDNSGLHRRKDPGVGAFTAYHDRRTIADVPVTAGDELLVDYGEHWFLMRKDELGPIPIESDVEGGEELLEKFTRLQQDRGESISTKLTKLFDKYIGSQETESDPQAMYKDFWERFVLRSPFRDSSRVLNVFPKSWKETEEMIEKGVKEKRKEDRHRSMEWLKDHGTCADNMEVRRSTIRQAGRGAFATRFLPEGTIVAPLPLIHLPDRELLDLYDFKKDRETGKLVVDKSRPSIGKQLLLNYCMGHSESTLLLCPYGVHTGFVNHNQMQANVRLQWANPIRSNHYPDWLNLTVGELDQMEHAGLAMELVATHDIYPDDEIFLDYGQEWEDAWNNHVKSWKPFPGSEKHRGAHEMNQDEEILRTVFDEMVDPLYPKDVELKCRDTFVDTPWRYFYPDRLHRVFNQFREKLLSCDVTSSEVDGEGRVLYNAVLRDSSSTRLEKLPRDAFRFADHPYTSDMHLPNAFRHEIMIPDDIFPEKWKNLV